MGTKDALTEKVYSGKDIMRIAYPILISLLMEQMIGMTDTAFLGRVGEVELGAAAIAGIYYLAVFMMGFGFGVGAQILIARRNGEKHYDEIGEIFYQGIYFMLGLALFAFLLTKIISPFLLPVIVSSPHICEAALSYIDWRIFGFFFSFIAVMFRAFFVGTTQTKTLTLNSVIMVLSNVVFNYILVFGKFGFPALGIAGAAIGSSLAELVSVVFFILYTYRRVDLVKYGLVHPVRYSWCKLRRMLDVSFWTMIQNFISLSTWVLVLSFRGTPRRACFGRNQCRTQYLRNTLYGCGCFCFHVQCPGQQSDRLGKRRHGDVHHSSARPSDFYDSVADGRMFCSFSESDIGCLHQYTGFDCCRYSFAMGLLYDSFADCSGKYLFPGRFRYG